MRAIADYALVLFDMDGTLYRQRGLRMAMAARLLLYGLPDLPIVLSFRRLRESWTGGAEAGEDALFDAQTAALAARMGRTKERVRGAVTRWIYREPIALLQKYADRQVVGLVKKLDAGGVPVAVYSDYPAKEKAAALGLDGIPCFSAEDAEIGALKPDPKGMRTIMARYGIADAGTVLLIGDREEKDGAAARAAGAEALILRHGARRRARQIKALQSAGLWP